ncbi:DUF92 domain-containing protein [Chitinophaga nivalis]|uniref:DUF92 domain-containing protein n=1 Tax=Chitinophaga nivalis TaxID=2991709 RepID=A0ABT3II42_9BACT|nr:DUF92 domain-containing protein [Chitinophaga nivalis]MCW3466683.1 DUF92 domain-containing protein [Chitinophaga nivalis]MCW3483626.1 DUF92 domain-containing protein [Chitinophaga nivalis]
MHLPSIAETSILLFVLIAFMALCIRTRKLSVPAALTAGLTGMVVFLGTSYTGLLLLVLFFILGTLATSHGKKKKAALTPEAAHPEQRKASQVFANGGVAALSALAAIVDPAHQSLYIVMLAGSLASATADTLSSELGMVYGRRFYNILSWKKEPKGLDGVVSIEGTLLGAAGAVVIAGVYGLTAGFGVACLFITLAGILGNLMDSILGAALERKYYIGNDTVNFLNTLFAALVAGVLYGIS